MNIAIAPVDGYLPFPFCHTVWMWYSNAGLKIITCNEAKMLIGAKYSYLRTTDIQGRSQNLRHFYPGMGLKLGYLGFSQSK